MNEICNYDILLSFQLLLGYSWIVTAEPSIGTTIGYLPLVCRRAKKDYVGVCLGESKALRIDNQIEATVKSSTFTCRVPCQF